MAGGRSAFESLFDVGSTLVRIDSAGHAKIYLQTMKEIKLSQILYILKPAELRNGQFSMKLRKTALWHLIITRLEASYSDNGCFTCLKYHFKIYNTTV